MDGEQKVIIPLDSPLDYNSNDQLVPVTAPRFIHNTQRHLASLLENSLRYEDDGWFAGWWGHKFQASSTADSQIPGGIPDETGKVPEGQQAVVTKQYISGTDWYIYNAAINKPRITFSFSTKWWVNPSTAKSSLRRINDTDIEIKGATAQGKTFTAILKHYNAKTVAGGKWQQAALGSISLFTLNNDTKNEYGYIYERSGLVNTFSVSKDNKPDNNNSFVYRYLPANASTLAGQGFSLYTYVNGKHTWSRGTLSLSMSDSNQIDTAGGKYQIATSNVVNEGTCEEYVEANLTYQEKLDFTIKQVSAGNITSTKTKYLKYGNFVIDADGDSGPINFGWAGSIEFLSEGDTGGSETFTFGKGKNIGVIGIASNRGWCDVSKNSGAITPAMSSMRVGADNFGLLEQGSSLIYHKAYPIWTRLKNTIRITASNNVFTFNMVGGDSNMMGVFDDAGMQLEWQLYIARQNSGSWYHWNGSGATTPCIVGAGKQGGSYTQKYTDLGDSNKFLVRLYVVSRNPNWAHYNKVFCEFRSEITYGVDGLDAISVEGNNHNDAMPYKFLGVGNNNGLLSCQYNSNMLTLCAPWCTEGTINAMVYKDPDSSLGVSVKTEDVVTVEPGSIRIDNFRPGTSGAGFILRLIRPVVKNVQLATVAASAFGISASSVDIIQGQDVLKREIDAWTTDTSKSNPPINAYYVIVDERGMSSNSKLYYSYDTSGNYNNDPTVKNKSYPVWCWASATGLNTVSMFGDADRVIASSGSVTNVRFKSITPGVEENCGTYVGMLGIQGEKEDVSSTTAPSYAISWEPTSINMKVFPSFAGTASISKGETADSKSGIYSFDVTIGGSTGSFSVNVLGNGSVAQDLSYSHPQLVSKSFSFTGGMLSFAGTNSDVVKLYKTFIKEKAGVPANISLGAVGPVNGKGNFISLTPTEFGVIDVSKNPHILNNSTKGPISTKIGFDGDSTICRRVFFGDPDRFDVTFVPHCVIAKGTDKIESVVGQPESESRKQFIYDDKEYTLEGFDKDSSGGAAESDIVFSCTDIRTGEVKNVYKLKDKDLSELAVFVKQKWSGTLETENYWWIDREHIVELTKDKMILWALGPDPSMVNPPPVDDWAGDMWYVAASTDRGNWIHGADLHYGVSSNSSGAGQFYKLSVPASNVVKLSYLDSMPDGASFSRPVWQDKEYKVVRTPFGKAPSTDAISSYKVLDAAAIITASKVSASSANGLEVGIAFDRGLNQWVLKASGSVVTGYGHVGVDGGYTGGQLPEAACGDTGFNLPVYSIKQLQDDYATASDIKSGVTCYGTESQVWFISEIGVQDIVLFFENGSPISTPLNNNVISSYDSASFLSSRVFNFIPEDFGFGDLLTMLFAGKADVGFVDDIINALGPTMYYADPKVALLGYVNHTLGQYSYVYRNSTQDINHKKTSKDILFCAKEYVVQYKDSNIQADTDAAQTILQFVGQAFVTGGDAAATAIQAAQYKTNKGQNQSAAETEAAVNSMWLDFAATAVEGTISSVIPRTGLNVTVGSKLTRKYALSMFYSISDKGQVWAGPGFVQHNFVGQCIAQSVTDTQINGICQGYWIPLVGLAKGLCAAKGWAAVQLAAATRSLRDWVYDMVANSFGKGGDGTDTADTIPLPFSLTTIKILGVGAFLPTILDFIGGALSALANALEYYGEFVTALGDSIVEAFANVIGREPHGYTVGTVSKYDLQVEAPHAYGDKPMMFMWPCDVREQVNYMNESVDLEVVSTVQDVNLLGVTIKQDAFSPKIDSTYDLQSRNTGIAESFKGELVSLQTKCKGTQSVVLAHANVAVVEGNSSFLSAAAFKDLSTGVSEPVFPSPVIHDFKVAASSDKPLYYTAGAGEIISVSYDDTKLIDGPPSNIIIDGDFVGVASSYTAIEVKDQTAFDNYFRPYAITPDTIALNINRMNVVHNAKTYHAFDGYGPRIQQWVGGTGMDKNVLVQHYTFQTNDHFKRSNIFPPNQFIGNFQGPPSLAVRAYEPVANLVQSNAKQEGVENDIPGENKNLQRFSVPVHCEPLSTLPAVVRALQPYKLDVVEGITSLTTTVRNTQSRYKAPSSVDFAINGNIYRATEEFICEIIGDKGILAIKDIVATVGLTFIGATTKEAYFYSPATRLYYSFRGQRDLTAVDVVSRFKDVYEGRWDFVNQEVMFKVLLSDHRLDETSEERLLIARLNGDILGEVYVPPPTIWNERSDFKILSMAGGMTYQGPRRFVVNRSVLLDYMLGDVKENIVSGGWQRLSRYEYLPERVYPQIYDNFVVSKQTPPVKGWTHNPFRLVTSMLGIDEKTDCRFEWELTFAWTEVMSNIFKRDEFVCVNLQAETVTEGGMKRSDVTHVFLFKECFSREGNVGYYMFRFQSNNGIGNRERLYVWSDGLVALEDLQVSLKNITTKRTQPVHMQQDLKDLNLIEM